MYIVCMIILRDMNFMYVAGMQILIITRQCIEFQLYCEISFHDFC